MFKILITGDDNFDNFPMIKRNLDWVLSKKELYDVEIVSNSANWIEKLSEVYTLDKHFGSLQKFNNNNYESIFEYIDASLILWDGKNPKTKELIDIASKSNKPVKVVNYSKNDLLGFSDRQLNEIIKYIRELDVCKVKEEMMVSNSFSFIEYLFKETKLLAENK